MQMYVPLLCSEYFSFFILSIEMSRTLGKIKSLKKHGILALHRRMYSDGFL